MFRSGARRVWGHAAVFAWSNLIFDRSWKLVGRQSPAICATRAGGKSGSNFENNDFYTSSNRTPNAAFTSVTPEAAPRHNRNSCARV